MSVCSYVCVIRVLSQCVFICLCRVCIPAAPGQLTDLSPEHADSSQGFLPSSILEASLAGHAGTQGTGHAGLGECVEEMFVTLI